MTVPETLWQLECETVKQRCGYLLKSGLWSDCIFVKGPVDNQTVFQAHKLILAMASPVFEAMFYSSECSEGDEDNKPVIIPILHVQPEAFRALLQYIYTGEIKISSFNIACDLLHEAKNYMLLHLVKQCNLYISSVLDPSNVCRAYESACLFDEKPLMDECIKIISTKTKEVLNDSSFEDVELETVIAVCSLEHLNVENELELFNAVVRYVRAEQKRRRQVSLPLDERETELEFNRINARNSRAQRRRQGEVSLTVDGRQTESELEQSNAVARYVRAESRSPEPEVGEPSSKKLRKNLQQPSTSKEQLFPNVSGTSQRSSDVEPNLNTPTEVSSETTADNEMTEDKPSIRHAIQKIRFLTLTAQQFTEGPACSGLLTGEECLAVFMNISSRNSEKPMPPGFSVSRERRLPLRVDEGTSSEPCPKPSTEPCPKPSTEPCLKSCTEPRLKPSTEPCLKPCTEPCPKPSTEPCLKPSTEPRLKPSTEPRLKPSTEPCPKPSTEPCLKPSTEPRLKPSTEPRLKPSTEPSPKPSTEPRLKPSTEPRLKPRTEPRLKPSTEPRLKPSTEPRLKPSTEPRLKPSTEPRLKPSTEPCPKPSTEPCPKPNPAGGIPPLLVAIDLTQNAVQHEAASAPTNIACDDTMTLVNVDEGPIAKPTHKPSTESRGLKLPTPAEIVRSLSSREQETCELATLAARCMTCDVDAGAESLAHLVAAGGIPALVAALHQKWTTVQYNAAWALTNIACDCDNAMTLIRGGALERLVDLIGSGDDAVSEQAAWAVGNIAASDEARRSLVYAEACPRLQARMNPSTASASLAIYMRTYRLICQKPIDSFWSQATFERISPVVPYIENLLVLADEQVLTESCWVLYHLMDGARRYDPQLFSPSLAARLVALLRPHAAAPRVQTAALGAVAHMLFVNNLMDACIEAGCLDHIMPFLKSENPLQVEYAAESASKILRSTSNYVLLGMPGYMQDILDRGLLDSLKPILSQGNKKSKEHAAFAIYIICRDGKPLQHAELVASAALEPFSRLLVADGCACDYVLYGLSVLLEKIKKYMKPGLILKLREMGVPHLLITAQERNKKNRSLAKRILQTYFREGR